MHTDIRVNKGDRNEEEQGASAYPEPKLVPGIETGLDWGRLDGMVRQPALRQQPVQKSGTLVILACIFVLFIFGFGCWIIAQTL